MKVNHWVETNDIEASDLYMLATEVATMSYPSVDAQNAAIQAAMPKFKAALDVLISDAFMLGLKMLKHKEN